MTSYIPLSLRKGLQASLALAAATLLGVTGSNASAKSSNCSNKQVEETISFALTATADAPAGATGQARLESKETSTATKAELELDLKGLEVGTYSVDATLSDSTTVHLADLTVQEGRCQKRSSSRTSRTAKRGHYHHDEENDDDDRDGDDDNDDRDDDGDHHDCDENDDNGGSTDISTNTRSKIEIAIPSTVDVSAITTITVSSATTDNTTVPPTTTSTVLLTGEPASETSSVRFVANVRVTAPPASPLTTTSDASDDASTDDNGKGHGKGKGHSKGKHKNKHGRGHYEDEDSSGSQTQSVQGRALAMLCISGGVEKKNVFQFIATGAPADTELNIVVDGETVDTVTSSKHGCVKFCGLPDTVDLRTIDLLTITDANGVVLMQADF